MCVKFCFCGHSTANVSVLSWWFKDKDAGLVVDDSLRTSLTLSDDDRIWEIRISGLERLVHMAMVI